MFDAARDLRFEAFVGGRRIEHVTNDLPPLRWRTAGLRTRGHAELELVGIPPALADDACMLLALAAAGSVTRAPLHAGRPWAQRLASGYLVAVVPEGSDSVLRLLDPDAIDFDDPAKMAVSAVAVDHARRVHEAAPEYAEEIVQNALEWYPGDVGDGHELPGGHLCNQGNSLAYLTLSTWRPGDADSLFRLALERSNALVCAELGGRSPSRIPWTALLREVGVLVEALHGAPALAGELPSPALRLGASGLQQRVAASEPDRRVYFYEGEVAERLRSSSLQGVAAEIYERASSGPIEALVTSRRAVRELYAGGYRFADETPSRPFVHASTLVDPSPVPLISRVLAAVGHDVAMGGSESFLRRRWGLGRGSDRVA